MNSRKMSRIALTMGLMGAICGNRDYYNKLVCEDRQLTEEEHDLLKEVLK